MHALEEYIQANQASFYRLAYTYVKDRDAALDVVQNAVVQALTHAHTLKQPQYMKTWFYRILVNEGLGYLRKNKKYLPVAETPVDCASTEDAHTNTLELYYAISQLKPKLRTVIVLRFYEDMPLQEIAKITQTNLSTVKSRLYKALRELKTQLTDIETF